MAASGGVSYCPFPIGSVGQTAFVYPGSGNHYIGMGTNLGVQWPEILREMDATTLQLKSQTRPHAYVPHRVSWEAGWEQAAYNSLISDPLNMILGPVVHGEVVTHLVMSFDIKPHASIGYSLGESTGLFAMGAWPDRHEMLQRILGSELFTSELAGPCKAARKAWNIPPDEDFNWCVAAVNRPASVVKGVIDRWPTTRLLIVNTPEECVIGGRKTELETAIKKLDCEALFLDGVVTVHCDAVKPAAAAYRDLHFFPVDPPAGIRFYSCASGSSYPITSENTADSILQQALSGFDFTATVEQAYQDGVRVFLEMGPSASCTRMIKRILDNRPHLAISACVRGEDDYLTILKFIGTLISERFSANLEKLYGMESFAMRFPDEQENNAKSQIRIVIGGTMPPLTLPPQAKKASPATLNSQSTIANIVSSDSTLPPQFSDAKAISSAPKLLERFNKSIEITAEAHKAFLDFSNEVSQAYAKILAFQNRLLKNKPQIIKTKVSPADSGPPSSSPIFTREQCLEFATGAAANVLGPDFAIVDTYKVRVRLPDEPLMLVDRILSVEGEKRSLGSGRIVTEHDVPADAWYLDGGRVPGCISVEAGQADLFLCAYLGIDFAVKGLRKYRLLDASVVFHRGLPRPGDVIRYEIEIEKFIRQGDTYLFLFSFEGFIGNSRLISMFNGCAGFFTEDEIRNSGGIIDAEEDSKFLKGKIPDDWVELAPMAVESFDDEGLDALRAGNLDKCFGELFKDVQLAESLRLPGGPMKLIDRIQIINPQAGRFRLGLIRAEADIHPDDWFLTCHFMDDMVMPGTLMYECCAHSLRVFIQRLGWITDKPGVSYEPVIGVKSVLKCRGPVTPDTKKVVYEVEIKELGYGPEPYVIADAHMYADGNYIVRFENMSLKMSGINRRQIEAFWRKKHSSQITQKQRDKKNVIFDRDKILEFAGGKPSKAFGDLYKDFDEGRFISRLPAPPFSFIDRIVAAEPRAWVLKPDGWVEAAYDVFPDAWYFKANRTPYMPYCVLLEIALQTCGWMAAYAGSALKSQKALKFRNLEGSAILYQDVSAELKTLKIRSRMTKVTTLEDIIIEAFDVNILQAEKMIFEGQTSFGFFTPEALAQQKGIRDADQNKYDPLVEEISSGRALVFNAEAPMTPDDPESTTTSSLAMPAKALRMIDRIDIYLPAGGPQGLGYIRGVKQVDPDEWFFKAHFLQDPVCPGSLGIESFLQLIKFMAMERWRHLANTHRFEHITDKSHSWIYRGQIVPENREIEVEAVVNSIDEAPHPKIMAVGFLKVDGLCIYRMDNFGYRLVPC
jgi:3-hydroxymyristoyl/3-hydroxydecanoyl-(acyl carrier protein) dehydratase/malonyl CoA-acyl carrier protein transacylase